MNTKENMVLINEDEYEELLMMQDRNSALEKEIIRLEKENNELRNGDTEAEAVTIRFETFVSEKSIFGDYKSPNIDVVDSIQFRVTRGIVGYERTVVFDKLKELSEVMKEKLIKYIDEKYAEHIKKDDDEYNGLWKKYSTLKNSVEDFNRKHLFKVKI